MNGTLSVKDDVILGSNLSVSGYTELNDYVLMNGTLSVKDEVILGSNLSVSGYTELNDYVLMNGTLSVVNDVILGSNLSVSGYTELNDYVLMNGTLSVVKDVILGSNLSVSGYTELNDYVLMNSTLSVKDDVILGSNLSVSGYTELSSDLNVSGNVEIDGDIIINSNVNVIGNVSLNSHIDILGNVRMGTNLSVTDTIYTRSIYASNIQTSNIDIIGNYVVQGNLEVIGELTINDTSFPLVPTVDDVAKVLAVNDSNNYELMTLFHNHNTCEFKSLFGVFETGKELEVVSGVFDFGVPKYWLSGWTGRLFDGVETTNEHGVLAPDGSNVDMDTLELIEDLTTSNMDFKDFINISMYKTNGDRLNKIAGIVVNDYVSPNYYFFLGTIDPNHEFFKYKFKLDFEQFYSDCGKESYGSNYGYSVDLDSVRVPNSSLHTPGTNMFVVEFINTYDDVNSFSDNAYKFNKSSDVLTRKTSYYTTNKDDGVMILKNGGVGLYPHITYRRWRNSSKPIFYEKKYEKDIGWGDMPNIQDIYSKHYLNSNLKRLYTLTYNYIKDGHSRTTSIPNSDLDQYYEDNVYLKPENLIIHSNLNLNGNFIENNYNSITFKPEAFPDDMF
jgi:acyl-[acyl carrier protein]--UDP-N-acetylglucosamine O-acyltransferase